MIDAGILNLPPEIKYKPKDSLSELPAIQSDILNVSKNYVKKGGFLIYSTCTLRREENEDITAAFLKEKEQMLAKIEKNFQI